MIPEIQYRFLIDGTEVNEPVSWDGEEFVIKRSEEYFGLENSYSTTLKFWDDGAALIKEKYGIQGIEAHIPFKIEKSCDKGATWSTLIDGILNCANYTYLNGEVTVMMEESSFNRTFKNRIDTSVSLSATESIDGLPISDIQPRTVRLRSKAIQQTSTLKVQDGFLETTQNFNNGDDVIIYAPLIQDLNDLKDAQSYNILAQACSDDSGAFNCGHDPVFVNNSAVPLSVRLQINIVNLKIYMHAAISTTNRVNYPVSGLFVAYGATPLSNQTLVPGSVLTGTGDECGHEGTVGDIDGLTLVSEYITINYSLDTYVTVQPGEFIWLYYHFETLADVPGSDNPLSPCFGEGNLAAYFWFTVRIDPTSFISLYSETVYPDTESDVFLVHEALAKITEVITGQKDSLKSEYFGSGDSQPRQYESTGCQRYVSVTNGLNIRNMLQKDGSKFPVNLSFAQLYKMLDSIFCLGMRMEYDESEKKWFVRVENREYFYSNQTLLEFDAVSDITVKSDLTNYFNGVSIGYKKWQLNNGQTNGLDEFNTGREYVILNKNANKKLEIKSDAIAGGYPIEFTRRQQFTNDTTKDFETDNDIFIICMNRVEVEYDSVIYQPGYINEANELFPTIENLISPSTAYNIRISPARNLYRWLRFVKCSLHKKEEKVIKFAKGEGNYLLKSTSSHECDPTCEIDESADFKDSQNCFTEAGTELVSPETIEFEIPFDFSIFGELLGNSNRAIRVNCSSSAIYKGFLGQVSFKPNQGEGGTASFTLTTTPSNGAAFDEGYSDGFDSIP